MRVENISYQVNWKMFRKGYSFFIPCLNPKAAKKTIAQTMNRFKYKVLYKEVIVDGIRGLRVWRL